MLLACAQHRTQKCAHHDQRPLFGVHGPFVSGRTSQPGTMINTEGTNVDLYIPRKWYAPQKYIVCVLAHACPFRSHGRSASAR